ncbi:ferredoxin [Saccharopolyspora sp. ASAGF58]|uniref:ferredoxin n=1 Tax=Saccharopolyspora sp. ASAGF58 TaxID=2719023 RepID=UPI0014402D9A|nr:ferredoxin [Saccharopolyspora sp. ASAGF58]QIZ37215.1 ferredoxin [Saccharopolyspora sp. ASAGF58]
MRVTIDVQKCVGAGQCVFAAGDVFDQDDADGTVRLLAGGHDAAVSAGHEEAVLEAARLCPSGAVTVTT